MKKILRIPGIAALSLLFWQVLSVQDASGQATSFRASAPSGQTAVAHRTLIYCGKLIDPRGGQVLSGMSIIVTGNTITDVQKGYIPAAPGDELIDLKNRTVMPGLIDAHVHLEDQEVPIRN